MERVNDRKKLLAWLAAHWIRIVALAVIALIVIISVSVLFSHLQNKFRASFVDNIEIGSTKQEVLVKMGAPDYRDPSGTEWYWYCDEYLKDLEKLKSLLGDAFEELFGGDTSKMKSNRSSGDIEKHIEKMTNKHYPYIRIRFNGSGTVRDVLYDSDGRVSNVLLDEVWLESGNGTDKKAPASVTCNEFSEYAEVHYLDGSYWHGTYVLYEEECVLRGKTLMAVISNAWGKYETGSLTVDTAQVKKVTVPMNAKSVDYDLSQCENLSKVVFEGTVAQWNDLKKGEDFRVPANTVVTCTDGTVTLNETYTP
ncbi:MAG: hypothetical protein ACI3XE_02980 [Eubacteriales bacterium]